MPSSTCREMFSSTTIASSTTRPVATISAISERLLSEKPQRYITAQLPMRATGTAVTGIIAARTLARNSSDDQDHEADRDEQRVAGLVQRRADGRRPIAGHVERDAGGQEGPQGGQLGGHAVHGGDDVGLRLTADDEQDGRLVVEVPGVVAILDAVVDPGDVGEAHGRAVAVRDDERADTRRPSSAGHWRESASAGRCPRPCPWAAAGWRC